MNKLVRRSAMLALTAVLLTPAAAQAQPVTAGSFTLTGDPGDYISLGEDWSYDTTAGDGLTVSGAEDRGTVSVSITGHQGDWWSLDLAAPDGQQLTAKTYPEAHRYPFNGTGAGLNVSGDGRGCNQLTGSFTVNDVVFGPHGYVQTLDASYEQFCENGTAAARGTVKIKNPAPPVQLKIDLTQAGDATFSRLNGNATVHGTVSCSADATVQLNGAVTETRQRQIIRGSFGTSVPCVAGSPVPWSATATPTGDTPFQRGKAEVSTTASATDPAYQVPVTDSATTTVTLTRA